MMALQKLPYDGASKTPEEWFQQIDLKGISGRNG